MRLFFEFDLANIGKQPQKSPKINDRSVRMSINKSIQNDWTVTASFVVVFFHVLLFLSFASFVSLSLVRSITMPEGET